MSNSNIWLSPWPDEGDMQQWQRHSSDSMTRRIAFVDLVGTFGYRLQQTRTGNVPGKNVGKLNVGPVRENGFQWWSIAKSSNGISGSKQASFNIGPHPSGIARELEARPSTFPRHLVWGSSAFYPEAVCRLGEAKATDVYAVSVYRSVAFGVAVVQTSGVGGDAALPQTFTPICRGVTR